MAVDHSVMLRDSDGLAERLNITPWLSPPARALALNHGVAMEALKSRSGPRFDRAYLDYEISMHRMMMESIVGDGWGNHPELKRILEHALPSLHAHLTAAMDLRNALNARSLSGVKRSGGKAEAAQGEKRPCGSGQHVRSDSGNVD
jgi:putative membrane protein